VEELTVRLMPDETGDGPYHMAADEVLLQCAADGIASLRFYTWQTPTLSLGYFQEEADRLADPLLAELPFVRRATGGAALVHHHELTYCLALPRRGGQDWLRMHEVIAAALLEFGMQIGLIGPMGPMGPIGPISPSSSEDAFLCFHHFTPGDLMIGSAKIAGSAQRKQRGAVMQHGGILLARSPFTPSLPGILELTGIEVKLAELRAAIIGQLKKLLKWRFIVSETWPEAERLAIAELIENRYRSDAWNRKR
jgi:lipoate-protein ligase A